MDIFKPYSVEDTDRFDELLYPRVASEIDGLQKSLREIQSVHKIGIIISLLKDHSIKTEWLESNKKLAALLTSGFLTTTHLESLFNSCKHNANFTSGLEAYMTTKLA